MCAFSMSAWIKVCMYLLVKVAMNTQKNSVCLCLYLSMCMNEWVYEWISTRMHEWVYEWISTRMNEWVYEWMSICMNECANCTQSYNKHTKEGTFPFLCMLLRVCTDGLHLYMYWLFIICICIDCLLLFICVLILYTMHLCKQSFLVHT